MKALLFLVAVLSLCACSVHHKRAEVNDPSVYYALKGEEMTPTLKRVSPQNAGYGIDSLSSTNIPAVR